jgi:aminopeptidase N
MGFDLDPADTRVATRITLTRNPAAKGRDLVLFGEELELVALRLNGRRSRRPRAISASAAAC